MKTFFLSITLLTAYYLLPTTSAFAQTSQPIYGGGQMSVITGNITIDKKVANPEARSVWVDNLTINDPKYQPESSINFQINLTNTGDTEIKRIEIKDVFPQFVSFSSGPGSFDANTKTLSFEVNDLKPKESRKFIVVGKAVSANQLPIEMGIICMVNQVTSAIVDSGMSQDNTLFCLEKKVLGTQDGSSGNDKGGNQTVPPKGGFPVFPPQEVSTTPATGPQTILLFSLLPTGIAGWLLRKYS